VLLAAACKGGRRGANRHGVEPAMGSKFWARDVGDGSSSSSDFEPYEDDALQSENDLSTPILVTEVR
jgi:hypothetical protein